MLNEMTAISKYSAKAFDLTIDKNYGSTGIDNELLTDSGKHGSRRPYRRSPLRIPTSEQISAVSDLVNQGKTVAVISKATGVSASMIDEIIRKEGLRRPIEIRREMKAAVARDKESTPAHDKFLERDELIKSLHLEGHNLREIGMKIGLSGERVRRILNERWNIRPLETRAQSRKEYEDSIAEFERQSVAWVRQHPGCTLLEVSNATDRPVDFVRDDLPREVRHLVIDLVAHERTSRSGHKQWSEDAIIESLQKAASISTPLSRSKYDEIRKEGLVDGPSGVRILQRFSSWSHACSAAGIFSGMAPRSEYTRSWTGEELLLWVVRFLVESNSGSLGAYDSWSRSQPGSPSPTTIVNSFNQWSACRIQALSQLRQSWS